MTPKTAYGFDPERAQLSLLVFAVVVVGMQTAPLLIGGPAPYVVGCGLYKRAIHGWLPLSHWVGLGLRALIAPVAFRTERLMTGALTTLVMSVVAWESMSRRHAGHAGGLRAE
ncbi:hypothetical protein [Trinickia mobilis]|uniref:hypothetical protein n=1 Tax=Trinickia mobilis TaxID=2816356 RepID=UPI001A8E449D|nr:hypothetical protein [Trinickia mobilis]